MMLLCNGIILQLCNDIMTELSDGAIQYSVDARKSLKEGVN